MTTPAGGALLEVTALRVALGGRAILDVDHLLVPEPALVVVDGEAGSGKTALAAALSGGVAAAGTITVAGRALRGAASDRIAGGLAAAVRDGRRIAGCSVGEALAVAGRRSGRAAEALERFALLAARRDVPAAVLSGGEQQLLQVACAWCAAARVLVLDSPTVGLAADVAAVVAALAGEVVGDGGVVLWLEQDRRVAPAAPLWSLVRGRLTAAERPAAAAPSATAAASPPAAGEAPTP